jgi:hypothetical protein
MSRTRITALALGLALALPAAPALAQDNPFTPLPSTPAATPTPAPTPAPTVSTGSDTGTTTLYVIGGGLLIVFFAIGAWIARDARRSIPEHRRGRHAIAEPAPGMPGERRRDPRAKARARAKAKAQRRARRHNR